MRKLFSLFTIVVFLSSCDSDFKLTGEYKDIAIVYGVLNQNDTEHVLRIQKAFLGEEDALVMAQEFDSLYYDTTKVSVRLFASNGDSIVFQPNLVDNKEGGDFFSDKQILYKANATLDPEETYTLKISKPTLGEETSAETPLVKDFSIDKPDAAPQAQINLKTSPNAFFNYPVQWKSAVNGMVHRLTVRFYYREVNVNNTADTTLKSLDWVQIEDVASDADGGESMQRQINGEDFFRFIQDNLEVNSNLIRVIGKNANNEFNATDHLDFIIDAGGEDLYQYIELNKPLTGVVQEKPSFTNITNDLGVLSCRYQKVVPNKQLNAFSVNDLVSGSYTADLNFVKDNP